jgi:hypothetical protein
MKKKYSYLENLKFAKGYQAQHDDMFADMKEYSSDIQGVILDKDFTNSSMTISDFEDFGKDAFLYKLEQYCKQARLLREAKGLNNTTEK